MIFSIKNCFCALYAFQSFLMNRRAKRYLFMEDDVLTVLTVIDVLLFRYVHCDSNM